MKLPEEVTSGVGELMVILFEVCCFSVVGVALAFNSKSAAFAFEGLGVAKSRNSKASFSGGVFSWIGTLSGSSTWRCANFVTFPAPFSMIS